MMPFSVTMKIVSLSARSGASTSFATPVPFLPLLEVAEIRELELKE